MKQTDIIEYLEKLGYQPQKIRNNDYWYLSPLRDEKEASFKVNKKLNVWYDHCLGKGGNFIDFPLLYHQCSFKELLEKIKIFLSFHPQTLTVQQRQANTQEATEALEPKIKVIAAEPLANPALCRYLTNRKIPDMRYIDKSQSYKNHKDLNEYLVHQSQQQKQRFKLRRHQ